MSEAASYPGYASPTFTHRPLTGDWLVRVAPEARAVGRVLGHGCTGWTAYTARNQYVGLFPDKQAAGEALVRHAGYEVLR